MLLKCCTQYVSKFGKLNSGHKTGKCPFLFQSQWSTMPKNVHYPTIELISHASKVMLKILQARLQQCVNWQFPDVQAGFRKGRGTRGQIANIHWITEKTRAFQKKTSTSASPTMLKPLTVWITANCGKFKRREYQTTLPASCETCV